MRFQTENGVLIAQANGETLKDDTFKEKVGRVSVREISRTARERRDA